MVEKSNQTETKKALVNKFYIGCKETLCVDIDLTVFDLLRFCRYLAIIDERKEAANQKKIERNLRLLFQHRFGNKARSNKKTIVNLSDYKLSDTEEFVLSHGLNFCLPPSNGKREGEVKRSNSRLLRQSHRHWGLHQKIMNKDFNNIPGIKNSKIGDFLMTKECFQAIRSLRSYNNILISKPNKGAGVVNLNKHDYVLKMNEFLHDASKFENLGLASQNDNTAKLSLKFNIDYWN